MADSLSWLPTTAGALATTWLEQSIGGDCHQLDADGVAAVRVARGGKDEQILVAGFDAVTGALADDLDIRPGCPATSVTWREGEARVDGSLPVTARAVVVTVPPSVVLADGLTFDPALPGEKLTGLPSLASAECRDSGHHRQPHRGAVDVGSRRRGAVGTVAQHRREPGRRRSRQGGARPWPRRAEWTTSNAGWLVRQVDESLAGAIDVVVQDWGSDPWSRGAHTVPAFGADRASSRWAARLADTLFFAGEATAEVRGRGLVQGALSSGRRAADEVARALRHR